MERKRFAREEIEGVLGDISAGLASPVEGYIIGGLAMMRHGIKVATKDIDIVFSKRGDALKFVKALEKTGFRDTAPVIRRNKMHKNNWRMEGPGKMRFDVFFRTVCNCLAVTIAMGRRASAYPLRGKLALKVISPEDIFLFKSVTDREDDLADMRMVAGMGLDWNIIEKELRSQPDFWKWVAHHYVKLEELESAFGIRSPLKRRFAKDAEIAAGIACLGYELEKRPLTVAETRQVLKERSDVFSKTVLGKMVELGIVRKRGGKYHKWSKMRSE